MIIDNKINWNEHKNIHVKISTSVGIFWKHTTNQVNKKTLINLYLRIVGYPVVWWTVGATQMNWQPAPSIPLTSQLLSWRRTGLSPSILGCCPPVSFCLPLLLPPCTVPCRIVLASPADLVTGPYHFSLGLFIVVKRSSWAQWLVEFCFAALRWRCALRR